MTIKLGELIDLLEEYPEDKPVKMGFGNPHSYRGFYECLAFEPVKGTTVGAMLEAARSAEFESFTGWKGGAFFMDGETECYLAFEGSTGEEITEEFIRLILGDPEEA